MISKGIVALCFRILIGECLLLLVAPDSHLIFLLCCRDFPSEIGTTRESAAIGKGDRTSQILHSQEDESE